MTGLLYRRRPLPASSDSIGVDTVVAANIAAGAVGNTELAAGSVSLDKHAALAAYSVIGNNTAAPLTPLALSQLQQRELADVHQRVFPYPFKRRALWTPYPNTATVSNIGFGIPTPTTAGTVTARTPASTSKATRAWRQGFVSAAGAGSLATLRIPVVLVTAGDGSGNGGFGIRYRFVPSDAATVAGSRFWMGVTSFIGAIGNGEPSALTVAIGLGWGAADTNLKIQYGGSVAQTPIDLGANFPARTLTADHYEFRLFASPNVANSYDYTVIRNSGQFTATGTITGAATVVPQSTTFLTPFNHYHCNNATALAVGTDICEMLVEVDT